MKYHTSGLSHVFAWWSQINSLRLQSGNKKRQQVDWFGVMTKLFNLHCLYCQMLLMTFFPFKRKINHVRIMFKILSADVSVKRWLLICIHFAYIDNNIRLVSNRQTFYHNLLHIHTYASWTHEEKYLGVTCVWSCAHLFMDLFYLLYCNLFVSSIKSFSIMFRKSDFFFYTLNQSWNNIAYRTNFWIYFPHLCSEW